MELTPLTQRQARAFIAAHHRHNEPPRGDIIRVGLSDDTGELDAVAIVPPVPDGDDWACDRCNATILTRWGDEPFPVPTDGDWALCHDCKTDQEARQSPWPAAMLCACAPCRQQAQRWRPQLERALGINHPRTRAPLN